MDLNTIGKLLIVTGIFLILVGIFFIFFRAFPVGKLPGDIVIQKENFTFYFPITTSIIISIILSFILWIIFKK